VKDEGPDGRRITRVEHEHQLGDVLVDRSRSGAGGGGGVVAEIPESSCSPW
jgi:hypothetical protein